MMTLDPDQQRYDLDQAFMDIGKFLYHFSKLEREIDRGIAKLLKIEDDSFLILSSNITFSGKIDVFKSFENYIAKHPNADRKSLLESCFSSIRSINDIRNILVHHIFSVSDNAVVFQRVLARSKLNITEERFDKERFGKAISDITVVTDKIRIIVDELVPYTPSLDFSDTRNSMYLSLL